MSWESTVLHGIVSMMMHVLHACLIHLIMHNAERMYICIQSGEEVGFSDLTHYCVLGRRSSALLLLHL